jgi:mono/diheme cytochrome c family protein
MKQRILPPARLVSVAAIATVAACLASLDAMAQATRTPDRQSIERGRYLMRITGCNDCHTPGYAASGGKVPEQQWLTGDGLGWRGPWGTTYASNLRLFMQTLNEQQWVNLARSVEYRPPMPWFSLRAMSDQDLRALYRYVRHLGAAGQPAPTYVPPGEVPKGPHVTFPQPPG